MDDLNPYGCDFPKALSNLGKVLNKCIEMNLTLSLEKCEFLIITGIFLVHSISQEGLQVNQNKITIIKRVHTPQKQQDVRIFLGLDGYYRRFIKDFSKVTPPMFGLLTKASEFSCSESCEESLETLKDKLTTTPILQDPNWALPFYIHVDASHKAIGADLCQIDDNLPYSIYFINKNLSKAKLNYTVTQIDLLDIVHSLNKFIHYVTCYQTFVHTNHATIKYLMKKLDVNSQIIRWLLLL